MPNIFHQSVEDILKAATPEQKVIWNDIFLRYGERLAVSQLYIPGGMTGEVFTFVPGKAYFCLQLIASYNVDGFQATAAALNCYDANNVMNLKFKNLYPAWDVTAAAVKYGSNFITVKNIVFGRLEANGMSNIQFVGYRITY